MIVNVFSVRKSAFLAIFARCGSGECIRFVPTPAPLSSPGQGSLFTATHASPITPSADPYNAVCLCSARSSHPAQTRKEESCTKYATVSIYLWS